jgi:hypothetical protein
MTNANNPAARRAHDERMMARMRAFFLGIALAACAPSTGQGPTTSNAATAGNDSDPNVVCREETPTGSSISRKVCRTPEQIEEDRKAAEDMFRNQNARPDRVGRPSGN